jgi:hypothetical protein
MPQSDLCGLDSRLMGHGDDDRGCSSHNRTLPTRRRA